MEFIKHIRRPFVIEAVEITEDNMAEVAEMLKSEVVVKAAEEGVPGFSFISINRKVVPNIGRAFVGWFITRYDNHYRAYAPKVFDQEFETYADLVSFQFGEIEDEFDATPPGGTARPAWSDAAAAAAPVEAHNSLTGDQAPDAEPVSQTQNVFDTVPVESESISVQETTAVQHEYKGT